jgi:hypothetical protein
METAAGNPLAGGGLRMAACLMFQLEGGAIGSIAANYLNPLGTGTWGYETLRILGEKGMVESTPAGPTTRLVLGDRDLGPLKLTASSPDYFELYLRAIRGGKPMPLTLEEELSPTRWVIRAKINAK